jgi:hypothetical protein
MMPTSSLSSTTTGIIVVEVDMVVWVDLISLLSLLGFLLLICCL